METPEDLAWALAMEPKALAKWNELKVLERESYVGWVSASTLLRRRRVHLLVSRVLWDRPQRGLVGRLRELSQEFRFQLEHGGGPPFTGAGTGS